MEVLQTLFLYTLFIIIHFDFDFKYRSNTKSINIYIKNEILNDIQKLYDNTLYIHYIHVQHCHILFKDMLFHFSNLFSSILIIYPSFDLDIFDFYENLQNTVEITSNRSWCK